jgi:hypothetical protein
MKHTLIAAIIALATGSVFAHEGIELGPNKGRILEFSTNETMHGEVTEKDGKLHIAVLDKDMKPVEVQAQSLAATAGDRSKPVKLEVTTTATGFVLPAPGAGEWLILQYKETATSKPIIARLHFITKTCAPCANPEWRCACGGKKS